MGITTAVNRIGAAIGTLGLRFALAGEGIGPTMILTGVLAFCGFLSLLLAEESKGMILTAAGGQQAYDDAARVPAATAVPGVSVVAAD